VQQFLQGKSNNISYSQGKFVVFSIQHAMGVRHIVICSLSVRLYNIFSH